METRLRHDLAETPTGHLCPDRTPNEMIDFGGTQETEPFRSSFRQSKPTRPNAILIWLQAECTTALNTIGRQVLSAN
jgi:hypothetical protein